MRPASTVAALGPTLVALAAVGAPAHAQSHALETDPGRPAFLALWFGPESLRGGHALQAGVDVAVRLYRIPWKLHTGEYAFGEEVRVIADESYHDWMRAIVVRLAVAYPLFRL